MDPRNFKMSAKINIQINKCQHFGEKVNTYATFILKKWNCWPKKYYFWTTKHKLNSAIFTILN